ncbi:MAG: Hypothetical protein BHV28_09940 [Candidatus Tokpelaia hoelldobleri]|uniref:Uncharacterized protein n=1 Tax=Candidatus Tokpelaia hoelldobleri TaxID=1902579 RepID=A0A1U9JV10_9HYPH|nr:MAG: Hypothetical protein BHV28_09940 [Candidatus Tokpelaia hoelldoblerii]
MQHILDAVLEDLDKNPFTGALISLPVYPLVLLAEKYYE